MIRIAVKFTLSGKYLIQESGYGARIITVRKGQQVTFALPVVIEKAQEE